MFSRLFYLALGFAVGYLINSLRQEDKEEVAQHPIPPINIDSVGESAAPEPDLNVEEASPDFLQLINGIGPTYAKRLFDGGIKSYAALAETSAGELANLTKARSLAQVEDWIEQAKNQLK